MGSKWMHLNLMQFREKEIKNCFIMVINFPLFIIVVLFEMVIQGESEQNLLQQLYSTVNEIELKNW